MKLDFPQGFWWGAATSGPQTEGWAGKKHDNIYDYWFKKEPYRFHRAKGPDVNCDTYNKYREDAALMKEIGLNSFRTSIQWTRLIDDFVTCRVNDEGYAFYNRYIDAMLEAGIEPFINLFHFDMPVFLQDMGGWESKEVVELFARYARTCFDLFGDRVKYWITFNEPIVPVEGGYLHDFMYPNVVDFKRAAQVAYHTILAHAKAVQAFRESGCKGEVGIVLNLTPSKPRSVNPADLKAARIADLFLNRSFLDPVVHGSFPPELVDILQRHDFLPESSQAEKEIIQNNTIDFLGVNYYQPRRVKARDTLPNPDAPFMPEYYFDNYEMPGRRINPHRGWEISPDVMYDVAINIRDNYKNIKWFVSENGMGVEGEEKFKDENGVIQDDYRIDFVKEHLCYLHKGISEGSRCVGYHMWTFIDCWSWINSYKNRYGFVAIDLPTGKRTIKKSGRWIRDVVEKNAIEFD